MGEKLLKAQELLKKYNQEHLLTFYDDLNEENKELLLDQILNIDFELIQELYINAKEGVHLNTNGIEPIPYVDKSKLSKEELDLYSEKGIEAIKSGKLAVITMAGGQGTRLGHNGPKGTYDLGLDNHKSIFEILCDNFIEAKNTYGIVIPWYIMTSNENDDATKSFFEEKNFFGYPKEAVHFFKQGELPMISVNGKILLNEQGLVKLAANGHGGIFDSMLKNNILEELKKDGIEWVFICGVDNVLVKMVDPLLVGLCLNKNILAGGKSVVKVNPQEKVGVFCKRNGRPSIVEYTVITEEMANARDENGELVYGETHIVCNLFNIKALASIIDKKLPYYPAFKKASYMDENKQIVTSDSPNAYKFESFIFDAFSALDDMCILRVKRENEFAPVKNATGVDSPETARKLYLNYWNKN